MWQNQRRRIISDEEFDRMAWKAVVEEMSVAEVLSLIRGTGMNYETFMARVRFFDRLARSEM